MNYSQFHPPKLTGHALFLSTFFAWTSFGLNSWGSQLWPLILSLVYISSTWKVAIHNQYLVILTLLPIALIGAFVSTSNDLFYLFRGIASYTAFATILYASISFIKNFGLPVNLLVCGNILLILVGLAQTIDPNITSTLIDSRTTANRGVTSLTPEPTYFGLFVTFLSWIYLIAYDYKPDRFLMLLISINFLSVVLLAQSAMGILFFLMIFGYFLYRNFALKPILAGSISLVLLGMTTIPLLSESRALTVLTELVTNPLLLITSDASVNLRVAHVLFSLQGAFENALMPNGFGSFAETFSELKKSYSSIFWYGGPTNAIMSFFGAFIYELGIIGFLYLTTLFLIMHFCGRRKWSEILLLVALLNSAIPVAFPIIAIIFALLMLSPKNLAPEKFDETSSCYRKP